MTRAQISNPKGAVVLYIPASMVADRDVISLSPGLKCRGRTSGGTPVKIADAYCQPELG